MRYTGTPQPEPSGAGAYMCVVDCVNVRNTPSLSGDIVANYAYGEQVNLNGNFIKADGWTWGEYLGYSGNLRYTAVCSDTGAINWQKC